VGFIRSCGLYDNEMVVRELFKAEARGYLLKSDARRHLISAIESLASHRPFFTPQVSEALLKSFLVEPGKDKTTLTTRERGVVQLMAEGHTNKQIARLLGITLKTVETHRAAVMRKLNLTSSAGLVRYAIRHKLVEA
jgi:DNA-binding NarL/FixJ family response regulator